ncbi:MAG: taurine dioxygenase [Myxococcales bacterium]|nr:taurine dioxygenase [Myxococcales bacterium]
MRFEPLTHTIGAIVHDVDLTQPLTDATLAGIREGLLMHEVIFFRDQPLEPAHHRALAEAFGPPKPHGAYPHIPGYEELTILENDPRVSLEPPRIDSWHTDMTFLERPPLGSILHAVIIPPSGGDTMWSSLSRAYDALSPSMQEFLLDKKAIHDFSWGFRHSLAAPGGRERLAAMVEANPPREHPVVRTHPESGKKAIYVNPLFTTRIVGLTQAESDALLAFLYQHMITPEFTCRFRWEVNSVAFWDNRITLHRPVNDYWPAHRRMQRITIEGDRPS